MMDAEEDIDLCEEIASMNLTSSDLAADLGLISSHHLSPASSLHFPSLSPHSSKHSSKASSFIGEMTGKLDENDDVDSSLKKDNESSTTDSHKQVKLLTAVSNSVKTTSNLFGGDGDSNDLFSMPSKKTDNLSKTLFADSSHDDFLNSNSLSHSPMSSFDIINKTDSIESPNSSGFPLAPLHGMTQQQPAGALQQEQLNSSFGFNNMSQPLTTGTADVSLNSANKNAFLPSESVHKSDFLAGKLNNLSIQHHSTANVQIFSPQQIGVTNNLSTPYFVPSQLNTPGTPAQYQSEVSQYVTPFLPAEPKATFDIHAPVNKLHSTTNYYNQVNSQQGGSQNPHHDQNAGLLFIPSMYNTQQAAPVGVSTPQLFVPSQPPIDQPLTHSYLSSQSQQIHSGLTYQGNNITSYQEDTAPYQGSNTQPQFQNDNSYSGSCQQKQGDYQIQTGVDQQGKGIWQWIKSAVNKDWSEGASNLKKQIKNATESVLTTLDPGMEEYLKPVINVGVASQSMSVLLGVKNGFSNAHCVAIVKGQDIPQNTTSLLPVGFDAAIKATSEALEYLSSVNFQFLESYVLVAVQVFITELVSGSWSAMICLGIKDIHRNLILHSFSQPVPIPTEVVTIAYNRTVQNVVEEFTSYDITIDEAVKLYVPYTNEKDWCSALTGVPLERIISIAAQCLASDYKRRVEAIGYSLQQPNNSLQQSSYSANYVPTFSSQPTQQQNNSVVFNGLG